MINPWIYYIVNDEMPDLGTLGLGDEYRKRRTWAIMYCIAIIILWAVGLLLLTEHLIGYNANNFMLKFCLLYFSSLALLTFLIIFGMNKILDSNNKKKAKKEAKNKIKSKKEMEHKELEELRIKDLCARLPYGVIAKVEEPQGYENRKIENFSYNMFCTSEKEYEAEDIKPYLRPMSDMTEEEKTEFLRFITWIFDCDYQANTLKEVLNGNEIETDLVVELFDWLNDNHFDYRGLIPMGLALPAPEGMYTELQTINQ